MTEKAIGELQSQLLAIGVGPSQHRFAYLTKYAQFLAEADRLDEADEVVEQLRQFALGNRPSLPHYWYAAGVVDLERDRPAEAVDFLELAGARSEDFAIHYMLGRAYLESGKLGNAISEFVGLLRKYTQNRLMHASWSVKLHYYLGRAFEESRRYEEASEQYQIFLTLWHDADPEIESLEDARRRLAIVKRNL